jgi:hypothetical protein
VTFKVEAINIAAWTATKFSPRQNFPGTSGSVRRYQRLAWNRVELAMEEDVMWIALFSIAIAAAAFLSVAAVMIQGNQGDVLRG